MHNSVSVTTLRAHNQEKSSSNIVQHFSRLGLYFHVSHSTVFPRENFGHAHHIQSTIKRVSFSGMKFARFIRTNGTQFTLVVLFVGLICKDIPAVASDSLLLYSPARHSALTAKYFF